MQLGYTDIVQYDWRPCCGQQNCTADFVPPQYCKSILGAIFKGLESK